MSDALANLQEMLSANPALAAGSLAVLMLLLILLVVRRRRAQSLAQKLRRAASGVLHDFVIPDGTGGEIQIEWALLTSRGIVILDYKDVAGHVFGSDSMQDWTVISEQRRYTFGNPQPAMYDRLAAVRRLIPDVPVRGYVLFSQRAQFTKGTPSGVIKVDKLITDLAREKKDKAASPEDDLRENWDRLRHEAVSAQLGHLLKN